MFAGGDTGAAFNTFFSVNFNQVSSGYGFNRAGLNAADASLAAGTASAFSVFPTAFGIVNFNWHR